MHGARTLIEEMDRNKNIYKEKILDKKRDALYDHSTRIYFKLEFN